ncbi:MAG: DNA polymerase III subunit gamma/tau [Candidatus Binataceae bacterium]|nr:DNA polymerase III subunit gamma/tau [Candidatus Binataceae bacterium]
MAAGPSPHLVLARKWRPERFDELVGQEAVTRILSMALESGRIAHAFLFTGIRGVGKTTAARILARCLNCEQGPTPAPCGTCAACVEIRSGRALDVSEIDGATYRKIDDARAIIENLSYRPARDRYKIYIIDEAHQLTDQAFNALLKTLEEPPEHVKFILATTEPQKMPETILSRLQRYDFRRIPFATIFARLKDLATREEIEAEEGAIRLLAREAGGSMRDAERMLEAALATGGKVTESEVAASLGVASRASVIELAEAIVKHDPGGALLKVRELHARGANLESCGRDLLETMRHLVVAKIPDQGGQSPLSDLPDYEVNELRRIAAPASMRDLMRLFKLMADAQEEILRSPYADLLLEMVVVRMATIAPVMDADELLRAIGGNSGSGSSGTSHNPPLPPAPATTAGSVAPASAGARRMRVEGEVKADAPRRAASPAAMVPSAVASTGAGSSISSKPAVASVAKPAAVASGNDMADLRIHIRSRRAALAGFMEQGASLAIDGDTITIIPRNDIYVRYLTDNRNVISELATELYGRKIKVEIGAPGSGPAAESSAAADSTTAAPAPSPKQAGSRGEPLRDSDRMPDQPAIANVAGSAAGKGSADNIYADPLIRRIFDTLEARLVEVRETAVAAPPPEVNPDPPEPEAEE